MDSGKTFEPTPWEKVLEDEHQAINSRRAKNKRKPVKTANTIKDKLYGQSGNFDTLGVALSGGGIRSAAFCIGALQALDAHKILDRVDYLSTVSGGGYAGVAVSSAMSRDGEFPFKSKPNDMSDPPALGHIRDYSNYLIPRGGKDLLKDLTIVVRGLVTNLFFILPIILIAAGITVATHPTSASLDHSYFTFLSLTKHFAATLTCLAVVVVLYAIWALNVSVRNLATNEFSGWKITIAWWLLIALAMIAFCELQPFVLDYLFKAKDAGGLVGFISDRMGQIITILTPALALVSFFSKQLGEFLNSDAKVNSKSDVVKRFVSKALLWAVALTLPVLIWMVYLLFCFWAIIPISGTSASSWLLLLTSHNNIANGPSQLSNANLILIYLIVGVLSIFSWVFLEPNANSLHRLYRDRLTKAFLFAPMLGDKPAAEVIKISQLDCALAPYHLINTALNIQGSPEANARGRNADFFFLGPKYSGSGSTKFMKTTTFEDRDTALSLGAAIAISGAAVSSNMGSSTIRVLSPTLALLNLRLGYWLENPMVKKIGLNTSYLVREMFGSLRPSGKWLYLTDGGHIDNTGLYELLRRRCGDIIVVDAEADPTMSFVSFVSMQRHARIDLGVRINLSWDKIAATSLTARQPGTKPALGPHCAFGEILYSDGGVGKLTYIKSSLSGDENVYVRDYARRRADFPHESTSDQFFTEEQFEVYRSLGFHCAHGIYKRPPDDVEIVTTPMPDFRKAGKATKI